MASQTPYHNLGTYSLGDDQWDHTDTVELVDSNVPHEDTLANRPSDPPTGRLFWATDARILFRYDPDHPLAPASGWVAIGGMGSPNDALPGTAHFTNLTVGGEVTGDLAVTGDITEGGDSVATERSTKTIDVLDHGDPTNADAALTDAVAAAEPYDTLLFRDNTFVFTENHTLSKPVSFEFVNAEVDDQRSGITVGATLFQWAGPGVQASDVLQADVGVGHHTIVVGTAGWASVGDTIYIEDTTGTEPITQMAVVDSVNDPGDGTQEVTFEGVVRRDFSANADVHIVDLWDRVEVDGAEVVATHPDGEVFAFEHCHRPRVSDVLAHEIGRHTVQFSECYDPTARGCEARNALQKGSGEGEPFICFRTTDVTWENCRTQNTRRGIDLTLGTTGATIIEPHVEAFTKGAISAHDGDAVRDVTIIGGEVASTDPNDGPCLSFSGASENISVYGTSLTAHRRAILVTGPADISAVDITLAATPSSDPELVTVTGDDVSIRGVIDIPVYENYVQAVDVDNGAANVDLALDINVDGYNAGGNENPLIQASSGASDVSVRGTIDSDPNLSSPAVRLYGQSALVENVDVRATILNHGGEGVQLRGDTGVDGLRVIDSHIDVDDDCVRFYQYDTGTSISNIWVRDSRLLSTNGAGLDAAGMAADSVWFLDNSDGGLANAGSVTNLHSERAELDKDETVTGAWSFSQTITGDITGDAGTLDGYDSSEFGVLAEAETVTAGWTFGAGATLGGALDDDAGNVVYDYTNNWVPLAALEADTVTVAGNAVTLGGSVGVDLVDLGLKPHSDLDDAPSDAHHTRYADSEARGAVTGNVDAADLTSANATAADQAPLSDGNGGLSWVDIIQGLYDSGDPVIFSTYAGPGGTHTTTSTSFTDPSAWAERGMLDWNQFHHLDLNGIITNWRIRWGAYRTHETTSGYTSTFRVGTYGNSEAPYSDGRSEMSVTNSGGPNYRATVQFSIDDITNYGVWTPVAEMKTDGGEARLDGAVFLQLKGDVV